MLTSRQKAKRATPERMTAFHTDEYVDFLNKVSPETVRELTYNGSRCACSLPSTIYIT